MNKIIENLWITDIDSVRERPTDRFDVVVSVCQEGVSDNVGCPNSHYNLSDGETEMYGGKCNYPLFESAASEVLNHVKNDRVTLVHCHAGQSRSASVCIAVLAALRGIPYEESRRRIDRIRNIHPDYRLVEFARRFIDEHE